MADRAVKCYLKALALNPLDQEAGVALSQIYIKSNDIPRALKLWSDMCTLTTYAHWCLSLKAQTMLALEDYTEAIRCFQLALELEPDEAHNWYCLGSAYASLYQDTSAQKAFIRAISLLPDNIQYQSTLANTERRLGLYNEAEVRCVTILQVDPINELALKVMADVCLAQAYQRYTFGWDDGAIAAIEKGINCMEKLIESSIKDKNKFHYRCIYKLLGDLFTFYRFLGPKFKYSNDCNNTNDNKDQYEIILEQLRKGEEAYRKVVELSVDLDVKERVAANYDLGCCLYYHAKTILFSLGQGSGMIPTVCLYDHVEVSRKSEEALKIFVASIRIQPLHSPSWNGLSVCLHPYHTLSLMTLARASQLDYSAAALANLSLLMTVKDGGMSAKACISAIQLIESNPLVWASLGVLLERNTETKENMNEKEINTQYEQQLASYDAYAAAIEVAKPTEALLGSAISYLKLNKLLTDDGFLSITDDYTLGTLGGNKFLFPQVVINVRHEVEWKVRLYLQRRPIHPLSWAILAQACEVRGGIHDAISAAVNGLRASNTVAKEVLGASNRHSVEREYVSLESSISLLENVVQTLVYIIKRCKKRTDPSDNSNTGVIIAPYSELRTICTSLNAYEPLIFLSSGRKSGVEVSEDSLKNCIDALDAVSLNRLLLHTIIQSRKEEYANLEEQNLRDEEKLLMIGNALLSVKGDEESLKAFYSKISVTLVIACAKVLSRGGDVEKALALLSTRIEMGTEKEHKGYSVGAIAAYWTLVAEYRQRLGFTKDSVLEAVTLAITYSQKQISLRWPADSFLIQQKLSLKDICFDDEDEMTKVYGRAIHVMAACNSNGGDTALDEGSLAFVRRAIRYNPANSCLWNILNYKTTIV